MDAFSTRSAENAAHEAAVREAASSTADAVGDIGKQFAELQEYASFLIDSKVDAAKAALRRLLIRLILGVLAVFTLCVLIAAGCVFLLSGIAQGLAVWLGSGVWLGHLIIGALVIVGIAGGLYCSINQLNQRFMERTQARYEKRKAEQLARFGSNVESAN